MGLPRKFDAWELWVFDFDETLFRTSAFHRRSFDLVLETLGVRDPIPRSYVSLLRGKIDWEVFHVLFSIARGMGPESTEAMPTLPAMVEGLERMFHGTSLQEQISFCVEIRRDFLFRSLEAGLPEQVPGLDTLVAWLRKTELVCGIATASPERFVHEVIARSGMVDVFPSHLVVGSTTLEQEEARHDYARGYLAKPHPFSVYLAAQRVRAAIGVEAEGSPFVYIGDSMTDCLLLDGCHDITGIIVNKERRAEFSSRFPALTFIDHLGELVP